MNNYSEYVQELPNGCWQWTGSMYSNGYGRRKINGKSYLAHRLVYEDSVGPIPATLVLDHLCRYPACVNPDHLEPVSSIENILRGQGFGALNARKTQCIRGHEFSLENTYLFQGKRFCKLCWRIRANSYYRPRPKKLCSCGVYFDGRGLSSHLRRNNEHYEIRVKAD